MPEQIWRPGFTGLLPMMVAVQMRGGHDKYFCISAALGASNKPRQRVLAHARLVARVLWVEENAKRNGPDFGDAVGRYG